MPAPEVAFLVDPYDDPVRVVVRGKACFQNSGPISDFIKRMIAQGRREFVFDFKACSGMDSTFMGILAGAVRRLKESPDPWRIVLCRLEGRNRQTIQNLGLDKLVDVSDEAVTPSSGAEALGSEGKDKTAADARTVLEAHEALASIDPANEGKFQDVIDFLRNQVES